MKIKARLFAILFVCLLFVSACTGYVPPEQSRDYGYEIDNYYVEVDVREDNSYRITEVLDVNFFGLNFGESHGLARWIPYKQTVSLQTSSGEQQINYTANIKLLDAREVTTNTVYFEADNESDHLLIKIKEQGLVNGKSRQYKYTYDYKIGNDRFTEYDFFYFNLLGYDTNTTVNNFSFKITFPVAEDNQIFGSSGFSYANDSHFYLGAYGQSNVPSSHVVVNPTTSKTEITGQFTGSQIQPFTALTIMVNLPEGYYSKMPALTNWQWYVVLAVIVLVTAIVLFIVLTKSKNKSVVSPVEFYPPDGIGPVEASFALTGAVTSKKITSLIIYFASKGYLNIIEDNGKISLQKIKDLPKDADSYEKIVFDAIFKDAKEVDLNKDKNKKDIKNISDKEPENKLSAESQVKYEPVSLKSLEGKVGPDFLSATAVAKAKFGKRIEGKGIKTNVYLAMLSLSPLLLYSFVYAQKTNTYEIMFSAIPVVFGFVLAFIMFAVSNNRLFFNKTPKILPWLLLAVSVAVSVVIALFTYPESLVDPFSVKYLAFVPLAVWSAMGVKLLQLNNDYHEKFGKVLGFRKTLLLSEKKRIEVLVKQDPSYFYNILPYAYALDITKEYSKKFEGLAIAPPSWYYSTNVSVFDVIVFNHIINSSLRTFSSSLVVKSPQTGGRIGGGGFGGGFSGGGFGGGGVGRI